MNFIKKILRWIYKKLNPRGMRPPKFLRHNWKVGKNG